MPPTLGRAECLVDPPRAGDLVACASCGRRAVHERLLKLSACCGRRVRVVDRPRRGTGFAARFARWARGLRGGGVAA